MTRSALSALALALVSGCGNSPAPVPFTQVKAQVFSVSCNFSSCHNASSKAGGLDLATDPWTALVNKPATWSAAASAGWQLVVPGDTAKSFLHEKVTLPVATDPKFGARMPNTGQVLDAAQLDAIDGWIANGAKND